MSLSLLGLAKDRMSFRNNRMSRRRFRAIEQLEARQMLAVGDLLHILDNPNTAPQESQFGSAVVTDGNLLIVGSALANLTGFSGGLDVGVVHVFNAVTGALIHTIKNPAPEFGDLFGKSVAISGNIIVVGAESDNTPSSNAGAVYLFDASSGALVRTITNPTPAGDDLFGRSVSISGNTLVVSAPLDDAGGFDNGAVHVFNAATGALLRTITNPTPASFDFFGGSVAISGSSVVIGARNDDAGSNNAGAAYLFDAATGVLLHTLANPNPGISDSFGSSVAISGNTVIVGAPLDTMGAFHAGTAYMFDGSTGALVRTITNPTPAADDQFGSSVAISGSSILIGASDETGGGGADTAYLYDAITGALLHSIANPAPAAGDQFGSSVSISGNAVVIGARLDDAGATNAGGTYVFNAATGGLVQTIANPLPAADEWFGRAVAISGNTIVVGANLGATTIGAAYVFNATTGALLHTISNPTPAAGDRFGHAVAISADTIVVGAAFDDTAGADAGAAYVFDASTGALLRTLTNPTPASSDLFGDSVAVSGSKIVVGARLDDALASDAGAVYVFDAATGALAHTLTNPTPAAGDEFAQSVSISGNTIAVGASLDDAGASDSGVSYLFDATTGNLVRTIPNPFPAAGDRFGFSVAISGSTVVVGAIRDGQNGASTGAAYAFDAGTGALIHLLSNPSSRAFLTNFGNSVAISGNAIVVGAMFDNTRESNAGAAHVYDAATGSLLKTIYEPEPAKSNQFGYSVAVDQGSIVVGVPSDDGATFDRGTAYIFAAADNSVPTAANDGASTDEDTPRSVAAPGLLANDTDPDPTNVLTVTAVDTSGILGAVTFNADGSFTYDPNGKFESLAAGQRAVDSFTYTIGDGHGGTDTATVSVEITGINDTATIGGTATGTTDEDSAANVTGVLTVSDVDTEEAVFTPQTGVAGSYGTFSIDAGGNWAYILNNAALQHLNAGGSADDTLLVRSIDETAMQLLRVTIHGVNDNATINGTTTGSTQEDFTTNVTGLLTVSDVDTGEAVFASQTGVIGAYGTFSIDAIGNWTYALDNSYQQQLSAGDVVSDSFTASSIDGTASQVVQVTIVGVNDAPIAVPGGPYVVDEGSSITLDGSDSTDAEQASATLTYEWDLDYDGESFSVDTVGATPTVSFPDNFAQRDIALRVTDSTSLSSTTVAMLTFSNAPPTAAIAGPSVAVVGQELTFTLSASDPSPVDQNPTAGVPGSGVFIFRIDWEGDGTFDEIVTGATGTEVTHAFAASSAPAGYMARVTATDKDGGISGAATIAPPVVVSAPAADSLQVVLDQLAPPASGETNTIVVQAPTSADADALIAAINSLTDQSTPVTIQLELAPGTYSGMTASPPGGVTLIIQGEGGTTVIEGASPALSVASGTVLVLGVTFANATDSPTILVTGGNLLIRNSTINETSGGAQSAIEVAGGSVDLGSAADAGNNTLNIHGAGEFFSVSLGMITSAVGNSYLADNVPLGLAAIPSSAFEGDSLNLRTTIANPANAFDFDYRWAVTKDSSAFESALAAVFNLVPDDDGTYIVTLDVDEDGQRLVSTNHTMVVSNVAPVPKIIDAPATSAEGQAISLGSAVSDLGSADTQTYSWSVTKNGAAYAAGTDAGLSFTPDDNGTYVVTLTVTDDDLGVSGDTATITVTNVAPTVNPIAAPLDPNAVNTAISASALFRDAGARDTHSAVWDWGDGATSVGVVSEGSGSGNVTGSHSYTAAGVYTVKLTVTDDNGAAATSTFQYVVVYDPSAGFVTGGGWINSPEGAYVAENTLTGKATFGFVSKYQKGASAPVGQTEFQFKVANLNFHSSSYEWLTVAGARAQYKGTGSINGQGNYGFLLTATDGQINGGGGADKFRIKIWDKGTGEIVYDNQLGAEDGAAPSSVLGGGQIVIHNNGGKLAGTDGIGSATGVPLTQEMLDDAVAASLAEWDAARMKRGRLSRLADVDFELANLPGSTLGLASSSANKIWLDVDGAGLGWSTDANSGGYDLVSAVSHEIGHKLGYDHDALGETLMAGEQFRPSEQTDAFSSHRTRPHAGRIAATEILFAASDEEMRGTTRRGPRPADWRFAKV